MIHLNQVTKRYPNNIESLSNISLKINAGEMVFLTGHSGAGKSTLLKLIALLEKPSSGEIIINGKNTNRFKAKHIPAMRRDIGLIFQNPHLLTDRNVFENIALPLYIAGYNRKDIAKRVRAALSKVDLHGKENFLPESLSCGEQQRIGIARAIINKPKMILADEPTGNLDSNLAFEIFRLFEQFQQIGTTIMIASHNLPLIREFNHRVLTLKAGQLISDTRGDTHG